MPRMLLKRDTTNESTTTSPDPLMTCEEFYSEKYNNFIKHIHRITTYYEDIEPWYNSLSKLNLMMFISLVKTEFNVPVIFHNANDLKSRDEATLDVLISFAEANGFDIMKIRPEDKHKLHRYAILFTTMIAKE